jgi:NTE family protein
MGARVGTEPGPGRSDLGLVVAGGAARGAWQAGVLRYIVTDLAKRLGQVPWPAVVSGTSVGALNGVNVAARSVEGVTRLSQMWREMTIDRVYRVRAVDVVAAFYNSFWSAGSFALLDARPLYVLVKRAFPEVALREAIAFGDTRAFIVSATELDTGVNTLFVDSHDPTLWLRPAHGAKVKRGAITAEHCLASAALPLLFEPVSVGGALHVDGMLRQNTPLRPVMQCGVGHVLVIGIDSPRARTEVHGHVVPTFAFVAGKAFNAILMDPVDTDLRQVAKINDIVRWGRERFGEAFVQSIREELQVREVNIHRVSPSQDLGVIARDTFTSKPPSVSSSVRTLLNLVADPANTGESDLLSYLLFDHSFTATIEDLGFEDARRQEEKLARFLLAAKAVG